MESNSTPALADPQAMRAWLSLAAAALLRDREMLNSANVFPVADSDTGTNMSVTLRAAAQGAGATPGEAGAAELLAGASRWALNGARGNSGVILSEWIRGIALAAGQNLASAGSGGGAKPRQSLSLGQALASAAEGARNAVVDPAPGSILTAMQAAADAALDAEAKSLSEHEVIAAAVAGARVAAGNSPLESAVLAKSGVLDSGACGFVLVLAALEAILANVAANVAQVSLGFELFQPDIGEGNTEEGFEVIFNLARPAGALDYQAGGVVKLLREQLASLGNSVVVIGGSATEIDIPDCVNQDKVIPSIWHAHVHVAELGPVLKLIDNWRAQGEITGEQVRFLGAIHGPVEIWAAVADPAVARELAEFGVTVQILGPDEGEKGRGAADFAASLQNEVSPDILALVPREVGAAAVQSELDGQRAAIGLEPLPEQILLVECENEAAIVALLLASVAEDDIDAWDSSGANPADDSVLAEETAALPEAQKSLFKAARTRTTAVSAPWEQLQTKLNEFLAPADAQLVVAMLPPDAPEDLSDNLAAACEAAGAEFFGLPLHNAGTAELAVVRRA